MTEASHPSPSPPHSVFFFCDADYTRLEHIDESCEELLGVPPALLVRHPTAAIALIHPSDRRAFLRRLESARRGEQFDQTVRLSRGPSWRQISLRATQAPRRYGWATGIVWDSSDRYEQLLELAERRDREVLLAARIQRSLLCDQTPVKRHGVHVHGTTLPSEAVDGDFYAHLSVFDGSVDVMLGDVMGKGVGAALLAAGTRLGFLLATVHLLRFGSGLRRPPEPGEIVRKAHSRVFDDLYRLNRFVTLAYARFDSTRARLSFVDCGNPPAIIYRAATGDCRYLKGRNSPLGFFRDEMPQVIDIPLERDDLVLYFSDGLSEAVNERGEQLGVSRVAELMIANADLEGADLTALMTRKLREFTGSDSLDDDLTTIAVKVYENKAVRSVKRRITRVTEQQQTNGELSDFLTFGLAHLDEATLSRELRTEFRAAVDAVLRRVREFSLSPLARSVYVELSCYSDWLAVELGYKGNVVDLDDDRFDADTEAHLISPENSSDLSVCYCAGSQGTASVVIALRYDGGYRADEVAGG